jgi:secondary thiamine-phosphate synthase enzyme
MNVVTEHVSISTRGNVDILDITDDVSSLLRKSNFKSGIVTVFVHGSTAALTTIEYEPGLIEDMKRMLEQVAPQGIEYKHNLRWGDGNGHSHIRASLLGPSITVPFQDSSLMLGTWQQIVFIDLDNRPRSRDIIVQIMGDMNK